MVRLIGLHVKPIGSGGNDHRVEVNMTRYRGKYSTATAVTSHCFAINLSGPEWSMVKGRCVLGGGLMGERESRVPSEDSQKLSEPKTLKNALRCKNTNIRDKKQVNFGLKF